MQSLTPIIGTGLRGLVGSKLVELFADQYQFETLDVSDPTQPVDITNEGQVMAAFEKSSAKFVVHMAAFTDVTAAWEQRDDKSGPAYQVNVVGTQNIVKACEATQKHLINISTAFVFNGENEGMYTEADAPSPIEWYGQTKRWAEEAVEAGSNPWTNLRIDFPFRSDPFAKPDIVRKTIQALEKGYPLFTNHYFGPTYIDDFAKVIAWVIRTGATGHFHASAGEKWSDYQLGQALIEQFSLPFELKAGDLDEYLKTLSRPYQRNTAMDCSKLKASIDFELNSVAAALGQVKLS